MGQKPGGIPAAGRQPGTSSGGSPPSGFTAPVSSAEPEGDSSAPTREVGYRSYTLERYHRSLKRLESYRWKYVVALVGMTGVSSLLLTGFHPALTPLGESFRWLTVAWLLPIPLLVLASAVFFFWMRYSRFEILPHASVPADAERPTVIFQVTTTGVNVGTVLNTLDSVLYWTGRHPELAYRPEVWAVIEGWGYEPNREAYAGLAARGVRVFVVPVSYRTKRGTTRKGRALQCALEERQRMGIPSSKFWVYHQDDETAVGEDTVLGIDEFIRNYGGERALGCGIILYPQHGGDLRPQQIQEFNRSKDDFRTLFTITSKHNVFSGFHGSHYIVRGDVEEETGWDVGPDMTSEDLIFENSVRRRHGAICHLLKGFGYEQAALDWRDQLRQRRRWFQGWWRAVLRLPFSPQRRIAMSYSMIVWMAALVSVVAMASSWVFSFAPLFPITGALAGFVWVTMISGYHQGYVLHLEYLPRRTVWLGRVLLNGVVGAMLDAIAPWYGTFTRRPRSFEVILKDGVKVPRTGPQVTIGSRPVLSR